MVQHPMGLKYEKVWNRLAVLLDYHQKLVLENREKQQMDRAARKIKRLVWMLERYNEKGVVRAHLGD